MVWKFLLLIQWDSAYIWAIVYKIIHILPFFIHFIYVPLACPHSRLAALDHAGLNAEPSLSLSLILCSVKGRIDCFLFLIQLIKNRNKNRHMNINPTNICISGKLFINYSNSVHMWRTEWYGDCIFNFINNEMYARIELCWNY